MLAKVYGSAVFGVLAETITVEVHVAIGIGYHLVGLPDNAVKESHYRIAAALLNNGYKIPGKKITINMAPAALKKEGAAYDLTLALGILVASEQLTAPGIGHYIMMGELSLDGSILAVKGVLAMAIQGSEEGFKALIVPKENAAEAAVVRGIKVYGVSHINEVIDFLSASSEQHKLEFFSAVTAPTVSPRVSHKKLPCFSEVKGQEGVKRCMEIAAAGGHNILLIGPPGAGKTMLAKRLPSILPPMTFEEALETTKIHSVAGLLDASGLLQSRPFRSPHHTISDVALVGGGSFPQPGEISLAHNGVLFLDELPEFKKGVLEVLRQPLEDRIISISRAKYTISYPASFMLVASMNPSPSGYFKGEAPSFVDSAAAIDRYRSKVSGPLLDRIDLHIEVQPLSFESLSGTETSETSDYILKRVVMAREIQISRFKKEVDCSHNAQMSHAMVVKHCAINSASKALLKSAMRQFHLSARAYDRILKVARTIADLANSDCIDPSHLAEAIQYRGVDKPF
ncbi:MAG: YifB family Mg chelatase-like AAA ATPase [Flavobacteriia bacterium]|nr:YifB family Mg chelatase-like AAA ATPase [Flavobacteriia bacterium]